jgi:hypothetical protein
MVNNDTEKTIVVVDVVVEIYYSVPGITLAVFGAVMLLFSWRGGGASTFLAPTICTIT